MVLDGSGVFLFVDASGLKEPEHVRSLQERVVRELQQYTTANYPTMPSKFSDLLLRIPELHRVCQVNISDIQDFAALVELHNYKFLSTQMTLSRPIFLIVSSLAGGP